MDNNEYYQQLQVINERLGQLSEGPEKEELLSLKQNIQELLTLTSNDGQEKETNEMEDEYALFMAEMAKEGVVNLENLKTEESGSSSGNDRPSSYKELEGKKYRAPHRHHWGQTAYHNAMICSVPNDMSLNAEFQVRVLYLNPTHKEMLPCPYYFDVERDCNFSEDQCHYSHGELVPFASLQEYIEPKFEDLSIGSVVLAKQENNLWYRAKIANISKGTCTVKFDLKNTDNKNYDEVVFENILPLTGSEEYSDSEDSSGSNNEDEYSENDNQQSLDDREDIINKSLMISPDSQALGEWEKYTKGIGSKLLQKMGYIVGAGLGKKGTGIIKPVTALVLPQGKSLDFCMNLKEQTNNPNLFNADRKAKGLQRKIDRKQKMLERQHSRGKKKEKMDVCEFINFTIKVAETNPKEQEQSVQQLREKLKASSDKELHVASFMVEEKIKKQKIFIDNLRKVVSNLVSSRSDNASQKLRENESEMKKLKHQALLIKNEMNRRKNNKEMTVF